MATNALPGAEPRNRLSRARVLHAAIAQADAGGLDDLSMRKLAEVLECRADGALSPCRQPG